MQNKKNNVIPGPSAELGLALGQAYDGPPPSAIVGPYDALLEGTAERLDDLVRQGRRARAGRSGHRSPERLRARHVPHQPALPPEAALHMPVQSFGQGVPARVGRSGPAWPGVRSLATRLAMRIGLPARAVRP